MTTGLPSPVAYSFDGLPEDVKEAVRFASGRGVPRIGEYRAGQLLMPERIEIRGNSRVGQQSTRARLHIPLLEELPDKHEMRRSAKRKQLIEGLPMPGDPAETGVLPALPDSGEPIARGELFEGAGPMVELAKKCPGEKAPKLWEEAVAQIGKGKLLVDGKKTVVDPASRCGVQRADKQGALGDLQGSSTNEAAAIRAPRNLPSRGHIVQLCDPYCFGGGINPLGYGESWSRR